MPRSMWRGAISFGMVAIPIRMYLATESKSVSFRLLCPNDQRPIRNKRWCTVEDREIGWNETVRGYEVSKDEFVPIDDDDLERLPLPSAKTVEILEFVEDREIEAGVYIKGAYYIEPEQVGAKPYALLRRALERTGKVAIGKIAFRDREHLCRLALHDGGGMVLNTLHWPDEIRNASDLELPGDVDIQERELAMAVMLVENLSASFDPARYHDDYREALLAVVEQKLQGRQPAEEPSAEPAKVMDLMAALRASVEQSRSKGGAPAAEETEDEAAEKPGRSRTATAARRRKAS